MKPTRSKAAKGKPKGLWQKTSYSNLVRNTSSGTYYGRFRIRGKLIWKSMDTDKVSIATLRLADELKKQREQSLCVQEVRQGKMTLGAAVKIVLERIQDNPDRKPRTKHNAGERVRALRRAWPDMDKVNVRDVKKADCLAWASKVAVKTSATRFNQFVRFLRWAFDVGKEYGNRFDNPAEAIDWRREKAKVLRLPEPEEFKNLCESIRGCGWPDAEESANFVKLLAYTGCRVGEARNLTWGDVDFDKGKILVKGDPVTGTKNHEIREVPMIPEAKALLKDIQACRPDPAPSAPVLVQKDCRKALANACRRIGIPRLTHHSLRHLFATRCIEAGVDIPTTSRWLGHKDGGALAMRVYGHLRDQHSTAMAAKVSFAPATNIVPMSKGAA